MASTSKLFKPLQLGSISLKHRVIMAPLTRLRSPSHIPSDDVVEYYGQRAADGGLLISEATHISIMAGSYPDAPGIYTPEQVRAWKKVTQAVHAKGGYIFCQLWHVGRTSHPVLLGGRTPLAPSPVKSPGKVLFTPGGPSDMVTPRAMTEQDIAETIEDYAHAAKLAMSAGFDGVEIHAASGYLPNQFLAPNVNQRTDQYGGSDENRARFPIAVVDAVVAAVGTSGRVGIRFSPFSDFQGIDISNPFGDFKYITEQIDSKGLAYVHIVEPRSDLMGPVEEKIVEMMAAARARGIIPEDQLHDQLTTVKPFRKLLKKTPLITCGFTDKNYNASLDAGEIDAAVFGRHYISNPDLPERLRNGWPLAPYDRQYFYARGPAGYIDYPTYQQQQAAAAKN